MDSTSAPTELEVEAALLVNEGGLQCEAVIFARLRAGSLPPELGERAFLGGARVARLDPVRAARRGGGVVALVLEDPMEARRFKPGDILRLERR